MCPNAVIPMRIFSIVHRRRIAQAKRYELSKIIKICFSKSEIKVDGDLQFFKNQGPGTITGNYVDGNLQSKENNPRPTISGNTVKGDLEDE